MILGARGVAALAVTLPLLSAGCRGDRPAAVAPGACVEGRLEAEACRSADARASRCTALGHAPCALDDGRATSAPAGAGTLAGIIQEADSEPRSFAGAIVRAWPEGNERAIVEATSDANGAYGFAVPPGTTVFYRADAGDFLAELHAATVPLGGVRMDLQLRHPAFFERALTAAGRRFDPARGLVIVELLGAPHGGVGARLSPHGDAPFVFDAPFGTPGMKAVDGERLLDGGHHFVVFANVPPGGSTLELLDGAGLRCAPLASVARWPVAASLVTQIDARCS